MRNMKNVCIVTGGGSGIGFALARHAAECGAVKAVLHIAGMSPHMGDAEKIMQANALGTVNINDAFFEVCAEGGCVIETSSTTA